MILWSGFDTGTDIIPSNVWTSIMMNIYKKDMKKDLIDHHQIIDMIDVGVDNSDKVHRFTD